MVDDADEAYAELEALTAIMGDDMVVERDVAAGSASTRRFALLIAPECVDSDQLVGSVVLDVCQPPGCELLSLPTWYTCSALSRRTVQW